MRAATSMERLHPPPRGLQALWVGVARLVSTLLGTALAMVIDGLTLIDLRELVVWFLKRAFVWFPSFVDAALCIPLVRSLWWVPPSPRTDWCYGCVWLRDDQSKCSKQARARELRRELDGMATNRNPSLPPIPPSRSLVLLNRAPDALAHHRTHAAHWPATLPQTL